MKKEINFSLRQIIVAGLMLVSTIILLMFFENKKEIIPYVTILLCSIPVILFPDPKKKEDARLVIPIFILSLILMGVDQTNIFLFFNYLKKIHTGNENLLIFWLLELFKWAMIVIYLGFVKAAGISNSKRKIAVKFGM